MHGHYNYLIHEKPDGTDICRWIESRKAWANLHSISGDDQRARAFAMVQTHISTDDQPTKDRLMIEGLGLALQKAQLRIIDANILADAVAVMIERRVLDSRSLAGDALLNYRGNPRSTRSNMLLKLLNFLDDMEKIREKPESEERI